MNNLNFRFLIALALGIILGGAFIPRRAVAQICYAYVENEPAHFPRVWMCGGMLDDGSNSAILSNQKVIDEHRNWHCEFRGGVGRRFLAFHKQIIHDYDLWRQYPDRRTYNPFGMATLPVIEVWDVNNVTDPLSPDYNPMPHGHPDCRLGVDRGSNVPCPDCVPLPLLFRSPDVGGMLHTFTGAEQLGDDLGMLWHASFHTGIAAADVDPGSPGIQTCSDICCSTTSPRDPMFWRAHKALDDVHSTWQKLASADVVVVLDRSGSMSGTHPGGGTKLEAAKSAARMFAELFADSRADGQQNYIGLVSYSSNAADATKNMDLTPALNILGDLTDLTDSVLDQRLNNITAGGSTSMGAGIRQALNLLNASGVNERKAILLLTDGMENTPPCLEGSTAPCVGEEVSTNEFLEFDGGQIVGDIQLCAVGFGEEGTLDGDLLARLTEREGGIYVSGDVDDVALKKFFVTCFGELTDEMASLDPSGVLPANRFATETAIATVCNDSRLTFVSGWHHPVARGEFLLSITTPSGAMVDINDPVLENRIGPDFHFVRIPLPYRGESGGEWQAALVRPQHVFVNGFVTDAFINHEEGVRLVREEIHRLCPEGCKNVLYYEDGSVTGKSVYGDALIAEFEDIVVAKDAEVFAKQLAGGRWDLVVYANQQSPGPQPYDSLLAQLLCEGQKAIITDTRSGEGAQAIFACAGVTRDGPDGWKTLIGDGRLISGSIALVNPGYKIHTYSIYPRTEAPVAIQARNEQQSPAIVSRGAVGREQRYFISTLVKGAARVEPVPMRFRHFTGEPLFPAFRIKAPNWPVDGYDRVEAKVFVTRPTEGTGNLLVQTGLGDETVISGDVIGRRTSSLLARTSKVPTVTEEYPLYDDGSHGDRHANNRYWSIQLPGLAQVEGTYHFRAVFRLTKDGCTIQREAENTIYVEVGIDPGASTIDAGAGVKLPDGRLRTPVRITPVDANGNFLGPGRTTIPVCASTLECVIDEQKGIVDEGDGSYSFDVLTPPGVAGARVSVFGVNFDIPLPCETCPNLESLSLNPAQVKIGGQVEGTVELDGAAPRAGAGGALVYLTSSSPFVAAVPGSVIVAEGRERANFRITTTLELEKPVDVTISASYGGEIKTAKLRVMPEKSPGESPKKPPLFLIFIILLLLLILILFWLYKRRGQA